MQFTLRNSRVVALVGVLVALCLAVQLSPRLPNVEFTSLFTFAVGFVFGGLMGILFGGFVMFVNGFLSPWGFAALNMPFQIAGMAIVGLGGGFFRKYMKEHLSARFYEIAILGAFLTVIYDFMTNFGVAFSYILAGMQTNLALVTAFAYGTPLSLVHIFSNLMVFGIVFFPLVKAMNNVVVVDKSWLRREQ